MRIQVELTVAEPSSRPRLRPRPFIAASALALVLILPGAVLAGHLFSDVPNTNGFHDAISHLAGAGVTSGCGPATYCPKAAVTREQMAGFLNRGLGRVAVADVQTAISGAEPATVGTLEITPGIAAGALAGANQFLEATYAGTVRFTDVTGCPCTVGAFLTANGVPMSPHSVATTVTAAGTFTPLVASGVVEVTGSSPVTVALVTHLIDSGGESTAYTVWATIIAETIPFGSTGGDTLSSPPASGPARADPLAVPVAN